MSAISSKEVRSRPSSSRLWMIASPISMVSSRVVRGSSLMACWSEGVRIRRCERRVESPSFCCMAKGYTSGSRERSVRAVEVESLAEIDPAHLRIGGELARGSGTKHIAVPENIGPVRDFQGLAHVVVGDEHADPAPLEVRDDLLDVEHRDGIDAREG